MERKVSAFGLVGVAAVVRMDGRHIAHAQIVLRGVAPVPWRAERAESIVFDAEPTEEIIAGAADAAFEGAQPLVNNGYKAPLAKSLVRRALTELTSRLMDPH
jgi:xanthine dehydrogenase YagS FAD-binding subunit